ncbi:MAG TPA: hypothetical protein PLC40_05090 [Candidatus Hydrogenedentes bacterium]|nr:hypothetical protein [Candidatus Hydrogenedentota bacterium]
MKDQLAAEVENDVDKLFVLLREAAKEHPERMVNLSKTKAESSADASIK